MSKSTDIAVIASASDVPAVLPAPDQTFTTNAAPEPRHTYEALAREDLKQWGKVQGRIKMAAARIAAKRALKGDNRPVTTADTLGEFLDMTGGRV